MESRMSMSGLSRRSRSQRYHSLGEDGEVSRAGAGSPDGRGPRRAAPPRSGARCCSRIDRSPRKVSVIPVPVRRIVGGRERERGEVKAEPRAAVFHVPLERRALAGILGARVEEDDDLVVFRKASLSFPQLEVVSKRKLCCAAIAGNQRTASCTKLMCAWSRCCGEEGEDAKVGRLAAGAQRCGAADECRYAARDCDGRAAYGACEHDHGRVEDSSACRTRLARDSGTVEARSAAGAMTSAPLRSVVSTSRAQPSVGSPSRTWMRCGHCALHLHTKQQSGGAGTQDRLRSVRRPTPYGDELPSRASDANESAPREPVETRRLALHSSRSTPAMPAAHAKLSPARRYIVGSPRAGTLAITET